MIITWRNRNRTGWSGKTSQRNDLSCYGFSYFWMHIVDFHMLCLCLYCFTIYSIFKMIFIIMNQFPTHSSNLCWVGLDWIIESIISTTTKGWTRHILGTIRIMTFPMQLWQKRSLYFGCFYCLTWIRVCKATFFNHFFLLKKLYTRGLQLIP